MPKLATFSERLAQLRREKAAREFRDVDQEEIAQAIGLSPKQQPYISKWENDTTPKDTAVVKKLAEYYRVSWLWLLHGEEGDSTATTTVEAPVEKVADPAPRKRPAAAPSTARRRGAR